MDKLWDNYRIVKSELESVVEFMNKNSKCKDKKIEKAIRDLIYSSGKMLRPAFVIISSHFGDHDLKRTVPLASVIEFFHMATLVHDDIIDDSKLRRGKESVQSKYGKDYAVYIGDYIFCLCFKILASMTSLKNIEINSNSMSKICIGEIDQFNSKFESSISVKNYLNRISGKTAELFSLALYIGAAESGCSDALCRQFWRIGHNIGMSFQIIDDILDYTGDETSLRKSPSSDISQGIFTIPFIYAAMEDKNSFKPYLSKKYFSDEDVRNLIYIVKQHNGIERSIELASKYTRKALGMIDKLPENNYKHIFKDITEHLLKRYY
ncbi:MAG: polyprenyl synthetase family protein [Clostridium sp.]|jgi:heptaprenyl diphosphate synthase|uniref:polyprenyl synthetase family protein n=1 Tax=Clostridium sp. TaxID=1506 RepID=UPI0025C0846E|nr:polyprenyl synthetase family protein [Clostridium sp.]MCH3963761.1 polyprenyl synthetase family protein [Clostridium sp.]MCI1714902.1 polyprenyl synthetase family protein [Clostridium sp.]MCI1798909.1 polyprenyl synthetase family protein [Clostridium sp.]MCI1813085.1 polyprenyl synthetase family protein [Clostridium sp.]MCI1869975.1 polyprenyl synthetase family protein [Clostridium sp.]